MTTYSKRNYRPELFCNFELKDLFHTMYYKDCFHPMQLALSSESRSAWLALTWDDHLHAPLLTTFFHGTATFSGPSTPQVHKRSCRAFCNQDRPELRTHGRRWVRATVDVLPLAAFLAELSDFLDARLPRYSKDSC
jgi:hypothetical protein